MNSICAKKVLAEAPQVCKSRACAYVKGLSVNWQKYQQKIQTDKIHLFNYPFQPIRCNNYPRVKGLCRLHALVRGGDTPSFTNKMLGHSKKLPSGLHVFQHAIPGVSTTYLQDHKLLGTFVVPGAYYLFLALAYARQLVQHGDIILAGVSFTKVLALAEDEKCLIQFSAQSSRDGAHSFEVHSTRAGAIQTERVRHAWGSIAFQKPGSIPTQGLAQIKDRLPATLLPGALFYQIMNKEGFQFGPHFQWIEGFSTSHNEVLCKIRLPEIAETETGSLLFPGLIDACFQAMAASTQDFLTEDLSLKGNLFVPCSLERLWTGSNGTSPRWCHVQLMTRNEKSITADIHLYNEEDQIIFAIQGLQVARISKQIIFRSIRQTSN